MEKREAPAKEKIVLPQNLQREMVKFFLKYSAPKMNADEEKQTPPNSEKELERVQ
jgi:hypothetical protein